ncbi:MAG: glycosyltransferase family 4 protein [Campylobacterales bacterium]|nr:glycosyltransferase family 4 protein [Campylobacterales bacterium]
MRLDFYRWFDFEKQEISHILLLDSKMVEEYDLLFASSVETAYYINSLNIKKDVLYLIQHYEDWAVGEKKLLESYSFNNFHNIVISKWLKGILEEHNKKVFLYLSNPINHNVFFVENLLKEKPLHSISMMYHKAKDKGSDKGIDSIIKIKEKCENLQATLFSVYDRPKDLPNWINFVKEPSNDELRDIYNYHTFFFHTSEKEGFGLPPAEAMACGAFVIAADSGGVLDFCVNEKTAIVLEDNQPMKFVKAFLETIENLDKISRITTSGVEFIKQTDWNKNIKKLDGKIEQILY